MRTDLRRSACMAALLLGAVLGASCKNQPEADAAKPGHAKATDEQTEKATIVAVDKATRLVTLKNKEGKSFAVQCGPEVRNFDKIEAGNVVVVRYTKSVAVALVKPPATGAPPTATLAAGRAEAGAQPAAAVAGQVTATVKIESVDQANHVVVFSAAGGGLRLVHVERPEGRAFMKGLEPGDLVEVTWTEAVAISVEKE